MSNFIDRLQIGTPLPVAEFDLIKSCLSLMPIYKALKESGINVESWLSLIPIQKVLEETGMSVETALERLKMQNHESVPTKLKRGVNEVAFEWWKEKLFAYNKIAPQHERVFISQNLFLDLIGGNVNTIARLYMENKNEIDKHNAAMGLEKRVNRSISFAIRAEYGSLANWLKSKIGADNRLNGRVVEFCQ